MGVHPISKPHPLGKILKHNEVIDMSFTNKPHIISLCEAADRGGN